MAAASLAKPGGSRPAVGKRLLAGPDLGAGAEGLAGHQRRLRPRPRGGEWLLEVLRESGLQGRGGAWFPTWRKWEAMAERSERRGVVVVNGSEGEPLSSKDRTLLAHRPHLVLDGAALAAESVGAGEIVLYLSRGSRKLDRSVSQALAERRRARLLEAPIRVVRTAHRYLSGESSAAVQRISGGPALPRFTPPHSSEAGVQGRPTLVQNVETLAHAALIARYGSDWYRRLGSEASPGSTLLTLSGNVRRPGVYEINLGAGLGTVLEAAGGTVTRPSGALLGGYFGTWLAAGSMLDLPLDPALPRAGGGASLGCGVLAVLPQGACGIGEAARILAYLERESAGQCGPCKHGLAALSATMARVAASDAGADDLDAIRRWSGLVRGRGACHHPDGAVGQLLSALGAFADHLEFHLAGYPCSGGHTAGFPQPPAPAWWSR